MDRNRNALVKEMNDSVEPTFWYFIASYDKIKGIENLFSICETVIGKFFETIRREKKKKLVRKKTRITLKQSGVLKMTGFMRHE